LANLLLFLISFLYSLKVAFLHNSLVEQVMMVSLISLEVEGAGEEIWAFK
jgi:hypothetical protein